MLLSKRTYLEGQRRWHVAVRGKRGIDESKTGTTKNLTCVVNHGTAIPRPPPATLPPHSRELLTRLWEVRCPPTDDRICGQNHCVRVNLTVRSSILVPFVFRGTEWVSN